MSVIQVARLNVHHQEKKEIEVGPIWNNEDGQAKGKQWEH